MRSLVAGFVIAAFVAIGSSAVAQEKPAGGGGKEHSMTGCVQKGPTADTFVIQNVNEKPKMIGVVESKANLAPHVGHTIEITGTGVPNKEAESMKNVAKADHYMRITAIKMVSASCK
jgi:hypothetical protein